MRWWPARWWGRGRRRGLWWRCLGLSGGGEFFRRGVAEARRKTRRKHMSNGIGGVVTGKVVARGTGASGVNAGLASLTAAERDFVGLIEVEQVRPQNVTAEVAERALGAKYPAVNVYCEKI